MRVAAAVLVLYNCYLDVVSFYEFASVFLQRKHVPPFGLFKLNLFDFLEFVKTVVGADRNFLGRIRLVGSHVQVNRELH